MYQYTSCMSSNNDNRSRVSVESSESIDCQHSYDSRLENRNIEHEINEVEHDQEMDFSARSAKVLKSSHGGSTGNASLFTKINKFFSGAYDIVNNTDTRGIKKVNTEGELKENKEADRVNHNIRCLIHHGNNKCKALNSRALKEISIHKLTSRKYFKFWVQELRMAFEDIDISFSFKMAFKIRSGEIDKKYAIYCSSYDEQLVNVITRSVSYELYEFITSNIKNEDDINGPNYIALIMKYFGIETNINLLWAQVLKLKLIGHQYETFLTESRTLMANFRLIDAKFYEREMANILVHNNIANFPETLLSRWYQTPRHSRDMSIIIEEMQFRVDRMFNLNYKETNKPNKLVRKSFKRRKDNRKCYLCGDNHIASKCTANAAAIYTHLTNIGINFRSTIPNIKKSKSNKSSKTKNKTTNVTCEHTKATGKEVIAPTTDNHFTSDQLSRKQVRYRRELTSRKTLIDTNSPWDKNPNISGQNRLQVKGLKTNDSAGLETCHNNSNTHRLSFVLGGENGNDNISINGRPYHQRTNHDSVFAKQNKEIKDLSHVALQDGSNCHYIANEKVKLNNETGGELCLGRVIYGTDNEYVDTKGKQCDVFTDQLHLDKTQSIKILITLFVWYNIHNNINQNLMNTTAWDTNEYMHNQEDRVNLAQHFTISC